MIAASTERLRGLRERGDERGPYFTMKYIATYSNYLRCFGEQPAGLAKLLSIIGQLIYRGAIHSSSGFAINML